MEEGKVPLLSVFQCDATKSSRQINTADSMEEPFWIKVLSCLGGVLPIIHENDKWNCNLQVICWLIAPILWCCFLVFAFASIIITSWQENINSVNTIWAIITVILFMSIQLSLSLTRKKFQETITTEKNKLDINRKARYYILLGFVFCLLATLANMACIDDATEMITGVGLGKVFGWVNGVVDVVGFFMGSFQLFNVIIRCNQLTLLAEYDIFLELVKGRNVEALRTKLLEVREKLLVGSREYFQGPGLIGCITGMVWVLQYVELYYKYQEPCQLIFVFIFTCGIVYPLYVLTSIEKFFMSTLRTKFHSNSAMPPTEYNSLMLQYDTIAPRASGFGIYITRYRVLYIVVTISSSFLPKILMAVYEHISI